MRACPMLPAFLMPLLGACAALQPFDNAPPSPARPWKAPELAAYSAALSRPEQAREPGAASIDPAKTYGLGELIDLAQRTHPVTRDFHGLTSVRGKVAAGRAALVAARSLEDAATARKQNGLATLPEVLQAQEETARATYDFQDALAAEHDARMALLESIGIRPGTPIDIADISQEPLPSGLEESVDEAIDRASGQRPDLIAGLAAVRAGEAEARRPRCSPLPRRRGTRRWNRTGTASRRSPTSARRSATWPAHARRTRLRARKSALAPRLSRSAPAIWRGPDGRRNSGRAIPGRQRGGQE